MQNIKLFILSVLVIVAMGGSACAPTVRYLTAENWDLNNKKYVVITSWQNTGGNKGESKVESCIIAENNGLSCKNQPEAEAALNVRGRGKGKAVAAK